MTYNDSNQLVTSNKSHSTFLIFNFEIFFFNFTFSSPFPRFFVKLDFLLECFSAKDCFLGASPNRECFRGMTGVCTELRLCSISNAVDDRRLLIVRSVYKNQELQFQENCPIFIYTRVLAIWSWSYTHFWDTGFAHSLYIAVNKVCDSVVTYNCKLILEVLLSSTNNTWLAKVSKLWIVRSSGIFGDYIHNTCSLLHLSYPPAARCVQLFIELHNTTQGLSLEYQVLLFSLSITQYILLRI